MSSDHGTPCRCPNQEARRLWLNSSSDDIGDAAVDPSIMARVESLYRQTLTEENCQHHHQREAKEKLALILLQSGRSLEADAILESLGFVCRLALDIFQQPPPKVVLEETAVSPSKSSAHCRVFDHVLSETELSLLQDVFSDIHGSYWTDHNYQVEPPSPYYSYVLPLQKNEISTGTLSMVIHRLHRDLQVYFPSLKMATAAEIWAHNRPHATGHQFHFDSDNEGCTEILRNPIVSCVLYLSHNVGGPTVVTNQRLSSRGLANSAWVVPASASNRLVAFDGKLLHGVMPGVGSHAGRRVSLMVAFWKSIRVRQEKGAAACQWPASDTASWADALMKQPPASSLEGINMKEVLPIPVSPVYEAIPNGGPWSQRGMPDYESMFQGI